MEKTESRGSFTGKMGFILAAAGSAVGLGNLWRFPYLAEQYGGGVFLITYLVLVLVFGISLMITELAIGRRTGKSAIEAFLDLSQKYKIVGWIATIVPLLVLPYYCVISGWATKYFFDYVTGSGSDLASSGFFESFTSMSLDGVLDGPFIWFLLFGIVTVFVVMFNVDKGVERVSKVLLPGLFLLLIGICVYMMTLPNIGEGLSYYLVPDFSQFSMKTVLGALGQLFYSLSLAMGILIAYGSYMKKSVNIANSARSISLMDTFMAFLSGLVVVPAVVLFSESGIESGPGLLFEVMPQVFESMPAGYVIGTVFFALAMLAALTSTISLAEAVVSALRDTYRIVRVKASILCLIAVLLLGSLSCFGYGPLSFIQPLGMEFLDFFDFITNSVLMPILALVICLIIGHVIGTKFITDEVEGLTGPAIHHSMGHDIEIIDDKPINQDGFGPFPSKRMYVFMIRWVCPIALATILVMGLTSFFGIYTI